MSGEISPILLKDYHNNALVAATLNDALHKETIIAAEHLWARDKLEIAKSRSLQGNTGKRVPEHHCWNWEHKANKYSSLLAFQFMGVEVDGIPQGLMLIQTEGKSCQIESQKGKPLVYIAFVATAPLNDKLYTETPRYGMIGNTLMAAAMQTSIDLGFKGRIGLHSLLQAESFYRDVIKLIDIGFISDERNLRYFEATPEATQNYLQISPYQK